ncbi:MAG: hypothetical protein OEY31_07590 [Candidatus Bathyarchaeota archaeon]|nr:hypothetical protein [Candidatus Bathyarchaeota archaeon]
MRKVRPAPILLPDCNLERARGLYVADGSFSCVVDHKRRRARTVIEIPVQDWEAIEQIEPCFGTKVGEYIDPMRRKRIRRQSTKALELARHLAVTKDSRRKVEQALKKCQELWNKGYRR